MAEGEMTDCRIGDIVSRLEMVMIPQMIPKVKRKLAREVRGIAKVARLKASPVRFKYTGYDGALWIEATTTLLRTHAHPL